MIVLAVALLLVFHDPIGSFLRLCSDGIGDAALWFLTLPVFAHFRPFTFMTNPYEWPNVTTEFSTHVRLVVESVLIALAIALPLGIFVHRTRWLYVPVFTALDAVYAIPSLALFSLLLLYTGLGDATVLIPIVAYCQFTLVRNVVAGLESVPEDVKEAARGMGLNRVQVLVKVEIPLALPVIVTGIRIVTVASIAMVALAALVAKQDLGTLFFNGVNNGGANAFPSVDAGAIAVVVLALGADMLLRIVEYFIPANRVARSGRGRRIFG